MTICKAKKPVIIIGRQFGSGGRRIGRLLAERFGVPFFDRELLREAATHMGYATEVFSDTDERRPSPFRSVASHLFGVADSYGSSPMSREEIYRSQCDVIREIGTRPEGCVIVGRSADFVLRDVPGRVSIFFHAPDAWRAARIVARGDAASEDEAIAKARRMDSRRAAFYDYFTPNKWGVAATYDLCIDSSALSDEDLLALIELFIKATSERRTDSTAD